jgi:hypothetical protein
LQWRDEGYVWPESQDGWIITIRKQLVSELQHREVNWLNGASLADAVAADMVTVQRHQ